MYKHKMDLYKSVLLSRRRIKKIIVLKKMKLKWNLNKNNFRVRKFKDIPNKSKNRWKMMLIIMKNCKNKSVIMIIL